MLMNGLKRTDELGREELFHGLEVGLIMVRESE